MAAEVMVTAANFDEEVLNSSIPVVVDFWAEWCVPCRMVAPILQEIAEEYDGKVKVAKVNVDEESELASKYNIISIPTVMVFSGGEISNQQVGAGSKEAMEALFKDLL